MSGSDSSTQARARLSLVEAVGTTWSSIGRDPLSHPSDLASTPPLYGGNNSVGLQLGRVGMAVSLLAVARPGDLDSTSDGTFTNCTGLRGVQDMASISDCGPLLLRVKG